MTQTENALKFSVITPSFNQGEYIEQTIKSVLEQNYDNFEHIVIDGGSTDTTLSVLKRYPHLKWISEPDKGQSDALNKGLKKASGDIIAWVNSDDWYEPETFKEVQEFFMQNPDENIVMGNCNLVDEKGNVFDKVTNYARGIKKLRRYWISRSIPTQPAVFFKKRLVDKVGGIDESLHYAMDYDLWLRLASKQKFNHIDFNAANYRFHSSAKGGDQDFTKFEPEWRLVYNRHVNATEKLHDLPSRLLYSFARKLSKIIYQH